MLSRDGETLQHFVDAIPVAVSVIDRNGEILAVNSPTARLLGFERDELLGQSAAQLLSQSSGAQFQRWLTTVLNSQSSTRDLEREVEFQHKEGSLRRLNLNLRAVPADVGTLALVTLTDNAEPIRSAPSANRTEPLLSTIQKIPALSWKIDQQLNVLWISGSALDRFSGTQRLDNANTLYALYGTDDSQAECIVAHAEALNGACTQFEIELNGRIYQNYLEPVYGHDDSILGASGIAIDITHLKHSELELRQREQLFRTIVESSYDWIWEINPAGLLTYVNPRVADILGHQASSLLGRSIYDFVIPEEQAKVKRLFEGFIAARQPFSAVEYRCLHADGTERCLEATGNPVFDQRGNFCGFHGSSRDVGQRKRAEQQLLNMVKGVSGHTTEEFFNALVIHLANAVEADYAFVAELVERNGDYWLTTLAFHDDGLLSGKLSYPLAGTPCEKVIDGQFYCVSQGLAKRYPDYPLLQDLALDAFVGMPLYNSQQQVVGIIVTLFRRPLGDVNYPEWMLQIFAARAGAELQRKRAEEALAKSHFEWTYAMDAFEDPVYLLDLDDRIIRANRAFYKFANREPADVIGRKLVEIVHPHGEATPCRVCQARLEQRDAYFILEANDPPGNPIQRAREITVRVVRDRNGIPFAILMSMHDLTRTRETEEELRRLNSHVRLLLESTGEGIFGVDADLRCTFMNRAAANMLGYEPTTLQGRDMHGLLQPLREDGSEYPRVESLLARTISEGRYFFSQDEVLWQSNGKNFPVQYSSHPIHESGKVAGAVVVFRNITEDRAMARRMDYLASHDSLTGLLNRHQFESRLTTALTDNRSNGTPYVLCYLDLDQFKVVNDTCGHVAGDQMLFQLSGLLQTKIPRHDSLARLGGDEFGVLLKGELADALGVLGLLREAVKEFRFYWRDKIFAVGVSVGVVPISVEIADSTAALSAADTACYVAKDSGRNRIHVYQSDDEELTRRHGEMQWVARIQSALENDRFRLFGQTIVSAQPTQDNRCHIEILLRMMDGGDKLVPPGAFLPAAERYNLMPSIDRWVIATTFAWLQRQEKAFDKLGMCSINLSGHSLSDETFLQFVTQALTLTGVPADRICFEITETAAVSNLPRAVHVIEHLQRRGCRFALDDFGSGMSSFAYLKSLPVDFLKIDGNFVKDIVDDPVDAAMVDAINKVGHVMGLQTIAEFVQSPAIAEKLCAVGVDFFQGYAIAEPIPLNSFRL